MSSAPAAAAPEAKAPAKEARVIAADSVAIRDARAEDLPALRRLIPHAFSAHFGRSFESDASFANRFFLPNCKVWVAESAAEVLGCMFMTVWGSFAWFGPLCVEPSAWGHGIGQRLVAATIAECKARGISALALYTMPDSSKHIYFYTKFQLMPR